ncbi:MAG: Tim44 domain-containing protein, partial [Endozoicomonas sp.]
FGGGKSIGRSFKTAPAPKKGSAYQQNQSNKQTTSNKGSSSRKGMLGGMLGGLLAGGLIASLLSGGGFGGAGGIQMMDILILALLAFVLFKVFRSMNRAKSTAGNHSGGTYDQQSSPKDALQDLFRKETPAQQPHSGFDDAQFDSAPATQSGFGTSDVPMNVPADFNLNEFLNGARDHYRSLQEAWNKNDFTTMAEYLSPELFEQMKSIRKQLQGDQYTEVMFVDAEMVRADYNNQFAQISLRFTGKYRDTVEGLEADITDIWHLERNLDQQGSPWLIVGIES